MLDYSILGFAGLILLVLGWIPQTMETMRSKRSAVDMRFALLYFLGSLLLSIYSFLINDLVFVILNAAAAVMALINLYFSPSLFGARRRK